MTRLVHLTDLHFGLHRADLVVPLRDAIRANRPDVVVASGDLTQRALAGQFDQAMAFLRGLGCPVMVIPGNHDLPAYNPLARLCMPFAAFRAGAAPDLSPMLQAGRMRLFGINTADPWQWRGGRVRAREIDRLCRAMRDGPADALNILVAHHPFEEPAGFDRGETRGARVAMARMAGAGLHAILSGHLHHWAVGLGIVADTARPVVQVQSGTALCARVHERDHGFAVLDGAPGRIEITPWTVDEGVRAFRPGQVRAFVLRDRLWHLRDLTGVA